MGVCSVAFSGDFPIQCSRPCLLSPPTVNSTALRPPPPVSSWREVPEFLFRARRSTVERGVRWQTASAYIDSGAEPEAWPGCFSLTLLVLLCIHLLRRANYFFNYFLSQICASGGLTDSHKHRYTHSRPRPRPDIQPPPGLGAIGTFFLARLVPLLPQSPLSAPHHVHFHFPSSESSYGDHLRRGSDHSTHLHSDVLSASSLRVLFLSLRACPRSLVFPSSSPLYSPTALDPGSLSLPRLVQSSGGVVFLPFPL